MPLTPHAEEPLDEVSGLGDVQPQTRIPGVETEEEKLEREQQEMIEEALRMNF